jgi:hypothetical protein
MRAGPTTLKLAGAAGTLVVCGASGLAVAVDTKPPSAPLKPPVTGASTATAGSSPVAQTNASGGLVIPAGSTCGQAAQAAGGARATPPPVPAGLQTVARQYAQAKTQQQRQQVLSGLTPDQRMQLTAYLQQVAQSRQGGKTGGLGLSCLGGSTAGGSEGAQINADVVAGQSGAPISVSAVS